MKNSQRGFAIPLVIVIIAILVIGGGLYVYKNKNVETSTDTSNWKTYKNEKYGFEFKYPKEWSEQGQDTNGISIWNTDNPTLSGGVPGIRRNDLTITSCDATCLQKYGLNTNTTIKAYLESTIKNQTDDTEAALYYSRSTPTILGNINGYRWQNMACGAFCTYVISVPRTNGVVNVASSDFDKDIMKEILLTFKFTK